MSDLVLAIPWWLFIGLIVIGGVVFWSGNNRNQKGPRMVGIALILLALLLKGISFFVETDKAKAERQTNELVKAVQSRDWSKFSALLEPDVSLGTTSGSIFSNSKLLVEGAKADCDRYNLTTVSASVTGVEQDAAGVTVDINASSEMTVTMGMAMSVPSSWKLVWERTGKDLLLHEVTCLKIGNEKPDEIGHAIAK